MRGTDDTHTGLEEYPKQERILNALAVCPERYETSNTVIAERTDEDIRAALVDDLQSAYRERLDELLEERGIAGTIDEA